MAQISTLRIGPSLPLAGEAPAAPGATASATAVAESLRDALLAHLATDNDAGGTISVDNKYFSARVELAGLELAAAGGGPGPSPGPGRAEDGIVVAFRGTCEAGATAGDEDALIASLTSVHAAAEAAGRAGDLLRLLVAVRDEDGAGDAGSPPPAPTSDEEAEAEARYSRRVLWGLDHGYEYVEADLTPAGIAGADHGSRDKEGFARVVEAVGGTVWSGSVSKKRSGGGGGTWTREEVAPARASSEAGPAAPVASVGDTGRDPFALLPEAEDGDDEEDDRGVFEDLERVMLEAGRVRAEARGGAMSDADRRRRASDAAMALAEVMDRLGLDSGCFQESFDDGEDQDSSDEGGSSE
jgi:hypothetical protein